jgi:hypothetical protein
LDIKNLNFMSEEEKAGGRQTSKQKSPAAGAGGVGEAPGAADSVGEVPVTVQSSGRAAKLEKVRKNIRSIDSLYKAYKIEIRCGNGSHQGYLQPFRGANITEAVQFRCARCVV